MQNKDEDKDEDKVLRLLKANNDKLTEINTNMLKVFWIVAIFALLYFGLMIYMLFLEYKSVLKYKTVALQANIYMPCRVFLIPWLFKDLFTYLGTNCKRKVS